MDDAPSGASNVFVTLRVTSIEYNRSCRGKNWAAPLRRAGVDVTTIITILYVRNDPIQLVWMVKQAH